MGVGALIGAVVGAVAGASGVIIAGFTAGTMWAAGAAIGSLFDKPDPPKLSGFGSVETGGSPTYSFGPIQNTKSQLLPVPLVYGRVRLAGNIIMQRFLDAEKTRQDMLIALGLGEFEDITDVKVNEIPLYVGTSGNPEGCSLNIYKGTRTQGADSRSLGGKRYPNTAYLAVTLKASEKISGNPTITSIVKGRKIWTPSGVRYTTNPAWVVYDILTGTYYDPESGLNEPVGLGLPRELIDLSSFIEAAEYCDQQINGKPRFSIDYTIDTQKRAIDHLADILACFRGALLARDKIALYIDKPVTAPYKAVGLDDIIEGSFTWWQRPDDEIYNRVIVEWTDPNQHWEQVISVFEDEEDIAERGIVERRYSLLGITNVEQAGRMGAYLIDIAKGSKNACQFALSIKDSDIEAGDVIAITHDLPGWENKWFRVVKVDDYDDDTVVVTASEYVHNAYNDVALDVYPAIDTGLPTPFDVLPPQNLQVTEWGYRTRNGTHIANLDLTWNAPPAGSARVEYYEVYMTYDGVRRLASQVDGQSTTEEFLCTLTNVPITDNLLIQVYTRSVYGDLSEPVQKIVHVIGLDAPPPPPQEVVAAQRGTYIVVDGIIPSMPDFKCLECRIDGSSWSDANYVGRYENFPFEITGQLDGTHIIRVKIIDNANQESITDAIYILTVTGINEMLNVILERDDIELKTGTLTNLYRRADGILVSYDTIQYGDLADTYGELDIETYQVSVGKTYAVLSPIIDTYKIGKTSLRFDFACQAVMFEATYGNIIDRTYGLFPNDTYGSISILVSQEIKVRFSNNGIEWSDWELYVPGEKTFRYTQYCYKLTPDGTPSHLTINKLKQIYDVPDIEIVDMIYVPAGGMTIDFLVDYGKDFYFPPRAVIPIILDNDGSIYPNISDITADGLKITCYNVNGTSVAHNVQLTILGY